MFVQRGNIFWRKTFDYIILFVIPVAVIWLLYINSHLMSVVYLEDVSGWAQYDALLGSDSMYLSFKLGQIEKITVSVKNRGTMTWISSGQNPIHLSYHIISYENDYVFEGTRTKLPEALKPGEAMELETEIVSPGNAGEYYLVLDMVHEGIDWFKDRGSTPLILDLEIAEP